MEVSFFVLKNETCASHDFSIKELAKIIENTTLIQSRNISPTQNSYASIFFILSLRVNHRNRVDRFCFSVKVNINNVAVVSWESERYETVTLRSV